MRFEVSTAALGFRLDAPPDLIFTDTLGTLGVQDRFSGGLLADLNVDVQIMPPPLPGAMLLGGIGLPALRLRG